MNEWMNECYDHELYLGTRIPSSLNSYSLLLICNLLYPSEASCTLANPFLLNQRESLWFIFNSVWIMWFVVNRTFSFHVVVQYSAHTCGVRQTTYSFTLMEDLLQIKLCALLPCRKMLTLGKKHFVCCGWLNASTRFLQYLQ